MRLTFLLFLITGIAFSSFSQDYIVKSTGDTIYCNISQISKYYLKYKLDKTIHFLSTDSIAGYKVEIFDYVEIDNKELVNSINGNPPKKYIFAISPGIGENHGIGGLKVLLGQNASSGIFGCVGYGIMSVFWKFGLQANYKWFYMAASIGTMKFYEIGTMVYKTNVINGLTIETGLLINLTKNKRFFIQLGVGYNIPIEEVRPNSSFYFGPLYMVDFSGVRPDLGIGVRF